MHVASEIPISQPVINGVDKSTGTLVTRFGSAALIARCNTPLDRRIEGVQHPRILIARMRVRS
jgi:hypothetical protein